MEGKDEKCNIIRIAIYCDFLGAGEFTIDYEIERNN